MFKLIAFFKHMTHSIFVPLIDISVHQYLLGKHEVVTMSCGFSFLNIGKNPKITPSKAPSVRVLKSSSCEHI